MSAHNDFTDVSVDISTANGDAASSSRPPLYVRQGSFIISIWCFLGGLCTIACAIADIISFAVAVADYDFYPAKLLISIYALLFGVMVVFLEAEPEKMQRTVLLRWLVPVCSLGRLRILDMCKFSTAMVGRGLFYFFIGSLGIIQWTIPSFVFGSWMLVSGVLLLAMCHTAKSHSPNQA